MGIDLASTLQKIDKEEWKEMVWNAIFRAVISKPTLEAKSDDLFRATITQLSNISKQDEKELVSQMFAQASQAQREEFQPYFQNIQGPDQKQNAVLTWLENGFGKGKKKKAHVATFLKIPLGTLAPLVRQAGIDQKNRARWKKELGKSELDLILKAIAGNSQAQIEAFQSDWLTISEQLDLPAATRKTIQSNTQAWLLDYWLTALPITFETEKALAFFVQQVVEFVPIVRPSISSAIEQAAAKAIAQNKVSSAWPLQIGQSTTLARLDSQSDYPTFVAWLTHHSDQPRFHKTILTFAQTRKGQLFSKLLTPKAQQQLLAIAAPEYQKFFEVLQKDIQFLAQKTTLSSSINSEVLFTTMLAFSFKAKNAALGQKQVLTEIVGQIAKSSTQSSASIASELLNTARRHSQKLHSKTLLPQLLEQLTESKAKPVATSDSSDLEESKKKKAARIEGNEKTEFQTTKYSSIPELDGYPNEIDRQSYERLQAFIQDLESFVSGWEIEALDSKEIVTLFWDAARLHLADGKFSIDFQPFFRTFLWEWVTKSSLQYSEIAQRISESVASVAMEMEVSSDWLGVLESFRSEISPSWEEVSESIQSTQAQKIKQEAVEMLQSDDLPRKNASTIAAKKLSKEWFSNAIDSPSIKSPDEETLIGLLEVAKDTPTIREAIFLLTSEWSREENWANRIARLPYASRRQFLELFAPVYHTWLIQTVDDSEQLLDFVEGISQNLLSNDSNDPSDQHSDPKVGLETEFASPEEVHQEKRNLNSEKKEPIVPNATPTRQLKKRTTIWEAIIQALFALRPQQNFKENIQQARALTFYSAKPALEKAFENKAELKDPLPTRTKALLETVLKSEPPKSLVGSGSLAQFLLHGQLPVDGDLKSIQARIQNAAQQFPNETKAFLQGLGNHNQIAHKLNLFLPVETYFSLLQIFGSFNIKLLRKMAAEMDLFASAERKSAGKTFREQLMAIAMGKGRTSQTSELLEATIFATATKVKIPFRQFLQEILYWEAKKPASLPNIAQLTISIAKKIGLELSEEVTATPETATKILTSEGETDAWEIQLQENINAIKGEWIDQIIAKHPRALPTVLLRIKKDRAFQDAVLKEIGLPSILKLLNYQFPQSVGFFDDLKLLLIQVSNASNRYLLATQFARLVLIASFKKQAQVHDAIEQAFEQVFSSKPSSLKRIAELLEELSPLFQFAGTRAILANSTARLGKKIAAKSKPKREPTKGPKWSEELAHQYDVEYAIPNAGVILVWPFFTRYFDVLGLLKGDQFVSRAMQERAAFLLCYLCNGNQKPEEADLVFPKILCGIPPSETLKNRSIRLKDKEKEMTNSLLKAIIGYWATLGETQPETLQETFLDRSGILKTSAKQWLLEVDKQAPDLLLKTLPWGLSPVNLSWMENMLNVEWT